MNRQMKRMQQRQGRAAPEQRQQAVASARRTASQEKKKRTPARQFLKEVRQELRKVDWPTRDETTAYTIVVLVTVVLLTSFVFFVDLGVAKAILKIFTN